MMLRNENLIGKADSVILDTSHQFLHARNGTANRYSPDS